MAKAFVAFVLFFASLSVPVSPSYGASLAPEQQSPQNFSTNSVNQVLQWNRTPPIIAQRLGSEVADFVLDHFLTGARQRDESDGKLA